MSASKHGLLLISHFWRPIYDPPSPFRALPPDPCSRSARAGRRAAAPPASAPPSDPGEGGGGGLAGSEEVAVAACSWRLPSPPACGGRCRRQIRRRASPPDLVVPRHQIRSWRSLSPSVEPLRLTLWRRGARRWRHGGGRPWMAVWRRTA